jgi:hypothetical protein
LDGHVLFLGVTERPDFIALDDGTGQVSERLVLIAVASPADLSEQFDDGVLRNARHANRRPDAASLDQSRKNPDLLVFA